jgi:hypothetical protein
MSYHWKALILTQANVLQNVEFECPSNWRKDAEAMAKSMYGAKEVRFCNPISKSSSSDNSSSIVDSVTSGSSFGGLLILGGLVLIYVFRYVILLLLIAGALYFIIKWLKK